MTSLQKSFEYQGDANQISFQNITLEIRIPLFSYHILPIDFKNFQRNIDGFSIITSHQKLVNDEYQIQLPIEKIVGDNTISKYGFFRYHKIETLARRTIDEFAFDINIIAKDEFDNEIETITFEAIYGIKSSPISGFGDYNKESNIYVNDYGRLDEPNLSNIDKLIKSDGDKIFLINKIAFDALREEIGVIIGDGGVHSELFLLFLIEGLVDLTGDYPKLIAPIEKYRKDWLMSILSTNEVQSPQKVLNLVIKKFDTLFDFPISIPEIEAVDVKGTFTISSEDEIKESYLEFYDLSVEYPHINKKFKIIRYDWSEHDEDLANNSTPVSFTKEQPIILNSIDGKILVQVKGFDGSVLWSEEYYSDDEELQNLQIEVSLYLPDSVRTNTSNNNFTTSKRLRGRVVQLGKQYNLNDLTVLVQAKKEGDQLFRIVGSTETDSSGNFSLPYPYGIFKEAQALVSLMPNSPANIEVSEVDIDNENKETISDDFIFLMLKEDEVVDHEEGNKEEEDCDCHTPQKAKRLPDQADLIESGEYTQDIGGTCLNLSTPNRTLREYNYNAIVRTSDPDVANYVLNKREIEDEDGNKTTVFDLEGGKNKIRRGIVDLDNPIRWEDAPDNKSNLSLYQAVTIATGHILHFKSVFKADGYSLGDLIYSLPLAPGQKKQIVVFESSHSFSGSETQSLTQGEQLSASLLYDRFITDELGGSIGESVSGRSSASTGGVSGGLGGGLSLGGFGVSLGVAGGYSKSSSSASQNSSRNISQYFDETLKQRITQNAESFRALNASVVTTVTEGQEYGVTAETIANHNHCHSLTMMYFEVLRHYAIFQEISHVEECIFVPLLMTNFSTENIHKWKDVLAGNLLPIPSNTYINHPSFLFSRRNQHPLLKGFDANERIKTNYTRVDFPQNTYAEDEITQIRGRFIMNVNIPRPKTKYDRILSLPVTSKIVKRKEVDAIATADQGAISFVMSSIFGGGVKYKTIEDEVFYTQKVFDAFMSLDANFQNRPPAQSIRILEFTPEKVPVINADGDTKNITTTGNNFFENDNISKTLWTAYANILEFNNVWELLNGYFKGRLISEWDTIFYGELLPTIFAKIIDSISISGLNLDFSTEARYRGGNRRINVNFSSTGTLGKTREELSSPSPYLSVLSNNPDIVSLKNHIKLNFGRVSIDYETEHFRGTLFRGYVNDDLLDGTSLYIPLTSRDKRNPRKEDKYLVETLIEHLNSNLEHYNKILWANLDTDRRYMLLDGFNIETFNSFGYSAGFRSLASIVKNQLITIAGNSLVFPVADGYKISQSFIMEDRGDGVEQEISLLDYYKPFTPIPPYRLSVPTRGVFMEAVQGSCDACEMVKENSSQDWDKFQTEEPTSIQPIVTPTPTITDYNPQYREFANPLVNIQNAPNAPVPGVALNQLTELLGKAGVFNDITGLAGNQQNAIKTYLSNQENAKAFAEMATKLASQQHNTANAKSITEQIKKSGLPKEKQDKLNEETIKQQIGIPELNDIKKENEKTQARVDLIQKAKEKKLIDEEQSKELTDDTIRTSHKTKRRKSRKRRKSKKKISLTILFHDYERRPMVDASFSLEFGSVHEILNCDSDSNGSFTIDNIEVDPKKRNVLQLKGVPFIIDQSFADINSYYYRSNKYIPINNASSYIINVQEQKKEVRFKIGSSKTKKEAIEDFLNGKASFETGGIAKLLAGKFSATVEGGRTWKNEDSTNTSDEKIWATDVPDVSLRVKVNSSEDVAIDDN